MGWRLHCFHVNFVRVANCGHLETWHLLLQHVSPRIRAFFYTITTLNYSQFSNCLLQLFIFFFNSRLSLGMCFVFAGCISWCCFEFEVYAQGYPYCFSYFFFPVTLILGRFLASCFVICACLIVSLWPPFLAWCILVDVI